MKNLRYIILFTLLFSCKKEEHQYKMEYSVSSMGCNLTYTTPTGYTSTVRANYTWTYSYEGKPGQHYSLHATNPVDSGKIIIYVKKNNEIINQGSSYGYLQTANVFGIIPE